MVQIGIEHFRKNAACTDTVILVWRIKIILDCKKLFRIGICNAAPRRG